MLMEYGIRNMEFYCMFLAILGHCHELSKWMMVGCTRAEITPDLSVSIPRLRHAAARSLTLLELLPVM